MPSEGSELELRAHKVCAPAAAALAAVLNRLQAIDSDVFYAIRSRPKSVSKTMAKVLRKRAEGKPEYEPETIRDVVGIRVVTLYREDVIEALKIFLKMINHSAPYERSSPFEHRGLEEKIVYTTAPMGDPEAITSRGSRSFRHNELSAPGRGREGSRDGIFLHPSGRFCERRSRRRFQRVPIEIQIRNVFEDAWGEIDHKIRYSLNRSRAQNMTIESWQPHLNVLKSFADGCAQYAGVIKNQALDPQLQPRFSLGATAPVDTGADAIRLLGDISPTLRNLLEDAYRLRQEGLDAIGVTGRKGYSAVTALAEAATAFEDAFSYLPRESFKTEGSPDGRIFHVPHGEGILPFVVRHEVRRFRGHQHLWRDARRDIRTV